VDDKEQVGLEEMRRRYKRRYVIELEDYDTMRFHFHYVILERMTGRVLYRTMGYNYGNAILERLNSC
jgi:hypothetical protein